jgi:hypothetical protein
MEARYGNEKFLAKKYLVEKNSQKEEYLPRLFLAKEIAATDYIYVA